VVAAAPALGGQPGQYPVIALRVFRHRIFGDRLFIRLLKLPATEFSRKKAAEKKPPKKCCHKKARCYRA